MRGTRLPHDVSLYHRHVRFPCSERDRLLFRQRVDDRAPVLVVEAHDIVFAEIVARLNFDDFERNAARILEAVDLADGDIRRLVLAEQKVSLPRVTFAVPRTTIQCSAR